MITEKRKQYLKNYRQRSENKLKHRLASKKWRDNNIERALSTTRKWRESHRERAIETTRKWVKEHPDWIRKSYKDYARDYSRKIRIECLLHYGNGDPKCVCCGEKELKFLALDHIEGGGTKHRKGLGNISNWAKSNGFPPIFQILCHNCNCAKGYYGFCPHEKETAVIASVQK